MSAGAVSQLPGLNQLLQQCHRRLRRQQVLHGLAGSLLLLMACVFAACLLDYLLGLSAWIRATFLLITVLAPVSVLWRQLIRPLLIPVTSQELGAAVDLSCPELHEAVATLLSVEDPQASPAEAGSATMRHRLLQQVAVGIRHIAAGKVVDNRQMWRRCGLVVGGGILILLPVLFWPSSSWLLLNRAVSPWSNLGTASNLYFEVPDGSRRAARGSTVTCVAIPRMRSGSAVQRPSQVVMELRTDQGRTDRLPMNYDELAGRFVVQLRIIHQDLNYRVTGGGAVTEWFRLTVDDAPEIVSAVLTEKPPAYTVAPIRRMDGVVGTVEVFERSQLEIELRFNKPISEVKINWLDWQPITSQIAEEKFPEETEAVQLSETPPPMLPDIVASDGLSAVFHLTAVGGGHFEFQLTDRHGLAGLAEPERRLIVVEDRPPVLLVTGIQDGLQMKPDAIVPLECSVQDDIGIGLLEIHIQKNADAIRIESAAAVPQGTRELNHSFRLTLQSLPLIDGDNVTIRVRAADQRPIPEPNVVWQGPWVIGIDSNAAAIGREALSDTDRQLIEQLRELETALRQDAGRGSELRDQLWQQWGESSQAEASLLSEQEQLRGRELQQLASQVAEHPLMQKQADVLERLGVTLREQIAAAFRIAAESERSNAAGSIQQGVQELHRTAEQLHRTIEEIEQLASLEQELTELNRLALEAEELAKQSDQLQQMLEDDQRRPEPLSAEERLQRRQQQQQLETERQQLTDELTDLLQRNQELLESARRSQLDRLQELSEEAAALARRQQQVAEAVDQESVAAAQTASALTQQLQQLRNQLQQLNDQLLREAPPVTRSDPEQLQAAIEALQQGNLAAAQEQLENSRQQLDDAIDELAKQKLSSLSAQEMQTQAAALAEQLQQLQQQISNLRADRNGPDAADSARSAPGDQQQTSAEGVEVAQNLLNRLRQLTEASKALARALSQDAAVESLAAQQAQKSADGARDAVLAADAGQFIHAAENMRQSAAAGGQAAERLTDAQQDRRAQLQAVSAELERLADTFQQLQQNQAARAAVQQQSQQHLARRTADLPGQLDELTERLSLPALALDSPGRQAQQAGRAAADAAQSGQQAASSLQQDNLRDAGESGRAAAEQLRNAGQLAQQGATADRSQDPTVPPEVGHSVTEALQSLERAGRNAGTATASQSPDGASKDNAASEQAGSEADRAQQSGPDNDLGQQNSQDGNTGTASDGSQETERAERSADAQTGSGNQDKNDNSTDSQAESAAESGAGMDGARQLSKAARALADAARGALPQPFTPGQLSDAQDPASPSRQATGNDEVWDGQLPAGSTAASRLWSTRRLQDKLDGELSDSGQDLIDQEYSELIRRYRRELARAAAGRPPDGLPAATTRQPDRLEHDGQECPSYE